MRLYNTLSGNKETFTSADDKVRMYVCGITPYAPSHIGHAMFSVVFDVVRRYLEFRGYEVKHVQNFTDIDDKMIKAASEKGITTEELAEINIDAYLAETDALNILRAHEYPRATLEIPKIVEMIETLVNKGFAYSMSGDVYFRVRRDEDYGKLSHRTLDMMMAGARVEVDEKKEDPTDFALWKGQKPGEPAWHSPWGPGRPGWHIECSAMSMEYLGETLDIHGGGQDLIFPHHENEIAQSESYSDKQPFARFWLHNGFLQFGEDKMSKSLGNIVTVRDALEKFSSDAIRLFFLNSHYRSPLAYSEHNIATQERAAERLRHAATVKQEPSSGATLDPQPYKDRFIEAMDDDLNTPRAMAALFDLVREINRCQEEAGDISGAQFALKELTRVLGLNLEKPESKHNQDVAPFVQLLVNIRSELRSVKQYQLADKLRQDLADFGILLEDTSGGTEWKFDTTAR